MKKTENKKMYYYFDEAGQPDILGHKGINLIEKGTASKVFMVGYLETEEHKKIASDLRNLQKQIAEDEYLVTKLLENRLHLYSEIDCYFSSMGNTVRIQNMNSAIQNAIHIFNQKWKTENKSNIRVLIQKTSEEPLLQAADYVLWTIQRAYERGEFRYYNFLQDKICLIHDIFDFGKYPQNYYSPKNPLEAKKIDPV